MARMRTLPAVVLVAALSFSCSHESTDPATPPAGTSTGTDPRNEAFASEAGRRAMAFQLALRMELTQAMQEGGPAKAIEVCSQRAQAIAASASNETFRVRRIGTRVRNAANAASERDQKALAQLLARAAGDDSPLKIEGEGELAASLYVPIRIAETCLACHGDPKTMQPEVVQALAQRYPSDQATGYALADLRGAVVVDQMR
jgi:hypothetical protein